MHSSIGIVTVTFILPLKSEKKLCFTKNLGFLGNKSVLIPNWHQERIYCGRIIQKSVFNYIYSFYMSKVSFYNGASDHFGFMPLEKNAGIFARDIGAKCFLKGFKEVNPIVKTS